MPEIEEFCVGFEFEFLNNTEWKKHKFLCVSEFTFDDIPELAKQSRVKYLDEQDILDLGFEYTNNDRDLVKDNIRIRLYIGKEFKIVNVCIYMHDYTVFKGEIKNINELKKILKQIEL